MQIAEPVAKREALSVMLRPAKMLPSLGTHIYKKN
jgi:hypothetical protein